MVQLILSSTKGNQGLRYFPHIGYLGLTPVRVEGVVRTKPDPDTKTCLAKSITISVRCYEARVGRLTILNSRVLVDFTQVLWTKPDNVEYEQISALEFPFRINIPARVAGFSTASYVDYRCMWRVEAVLNHAPSNGVGSRQIRHFELPLIRYDTPLYSPILPLQESWSILESSKPRAPRIRYSLTAPKTAIGPLDLVPIPIHIQALDQSITVRSATVLIERRIHLHDCPPSPSLTSTSSLQAPLTPLSLQPSSSSSSLAREAAAQDSSRLSPYPDSAPSSDLDLCSVSSISTITPHSNFSSTVGLLSPDSLLSPPAHSPASSAPSSKVVINSITDTESSGSFARDANGIWSKTLTLQWPAARSHTRWAIGETISTDLVSVKYFVRVKVVVTSQQGSETIELPEREVHIVSTNEAERELAISKYQEMESLAYESSNSNNTRSKSKSPRRSRPDRDRSEDPIPPSPALASSSASSSSKTSSNSRSKSSTRRPHTSAGPRDKPTNFAGGAYGTRNSRGQENVEPCSSVTASSSSTKRRSDLVVGLRSFGSGGRTASDLELKAAQQSTWPPSCFTATKLGDRLSNHSGYAAILPPGRLKESTSSSTTASTSSSTGSSSYGGESSESSASDSHVKEWEEELARIEVKSRRSSDLLGFSIKRNPKKWFTSSKA